MIHETYAILTIIAFALWLFQVSFSVLFKIRSKSHIVIDTDPPFVSILMPYFRESDSSIQNTIDSICDQQGVKIEIIVVDDGNTSPANIVSRNDIKLKHIRLPENKGKRNALFVGAKECSGDYIVVVDSDTILRYDAIFQLYQTLLNEKAGAVCGNIKVLNETQNSLTKVISSMYWFAFHMERSSQSFFGSQIVCSGALSMYKKNEYVEFSIPLSSQRSLGVPCCAGDDRHMTNQFIMHGHRSVWSEKAIAWTNSPHTLKSFIKQQLRWTRSFCLEIAWIIPRLYRFPPIYIFMIFRSLFKYLYLLFLMLAMVKALVVVPLITLMFSFVFGMLFFAFIKGGLASIMSRKSNMIIRTMIFGIIGYLLMTPVLLYGVMSCRKSGWLTRK